MKIFKKWLRRGKPESRNNDSMAAISQRIEVAQRKLADYLNNKSARWTTAQVKIRLIFFCLVAGGYSVFIVIHAIIRSNGPPPVNKVQMIRPPGKSIHPDR